MALSSGDSVLERRDVSASDCEFWACRARIRLWRRTLWSAIGPLVVLFIPRDLGMLFGAGIWPVQLMYAGFMPAYMCLCETGECG